MDHMPNSIGRICLNNISQKIHLSTDCFVKEQLPALP